MSLVVLFLSLVANSFFLSLVVFFVLSCFFLSLVVFFLSLVAFYLSLVQTKDKKKHHEALLIFFLSFGEAKGKKKTTKDKTQFQHRIASLPLANFLGSALL